MLSNVISALIYCSSELSRNMCLLEVGVSLKLYLCAMEGGLSPQLCPSSLIISVDLDYYYLSQALVALLGNIGCGS